jgi:hypothetical protein
MHKVNFKTITSMRKTTQEVDIQFNNASRSSSPHVHRDFPGTAAPLEGPVGFALVADPFRGPNKLCLQYKTDKNMRQV